MKKLQLLAKGKAKSVYQTDDADYLILEFRDDISAFNAVKVAQLAGKGKVNCAINEFIMQFLEGKGIPTHFVKRLNDTDTVVKSLTMVPLEAVIRNRAAGNLCKKYGIEKGIPLMPPLYELFLKSDALGDPLVRDEHALAFGWASEETLAEINELTLRVNEVLQPLFHHAGIDLVDFKLEFGRDKTGELVVADEFSPDGCRLWDIATGTIFDKDRFRQDLGEVVAHYQTVAKRLGVKF